jgi:hypothetical protein
MPQRRKEIKISCKMTPSVSIISFTPEIKISEMQALTQKLDMPYLVAMALDRENALA